MDYPKLVELIPMEKREATADKLVDMVLSSKNDDKMPSDVANAFLSQWQHDLLTSDFGLSTLLEGAVLLEKEKMLTILGELQLDELADRIRGEI